MATLRILVASFLICLFLVNLTMLIKSFMPVQESAQVTTGSNNAQGKGKLNCGAACAARCRLASRHKMCMRACGTCCARCNCVPPGTSGNRDVCRCYATMTTHGGRLKCP